MSNELTCFIFGIPALLLWCVAIKKGIMVAGFGKRVRRDDDPLMFWFTALILGGIAGGLVVMPVLTWLGLRG